MKAIKFIILLLFLSATSASAQKYDWNVFSSKEGAFSIDFPYQPKFSETSHVTEEGITVKIKLNVASKEPVLAYVLYNEFETGFMIFDDTLYLSAVTNQIMSKFGKTPDLLEDITFDGFPGKHFRATMNGSTVEANIILRTNRAYIILALFPDDRQKDARRFFSSFKFLPYQKSTWANHQLSEHFFSADFPEKPILKEEEAEDGSNLLSYSSQDKNSGLNYIVTTNKYSPYEEFDSDSAVLASIAYTYVMQGDSIVEEKDITVDNRPGKELILIRGVNHFRIRMRIFTHGELGYTVFSLLPPTELRSETSNRFFESFHFRGKPPGDLTSDKSEVILKDLVHSDTSVWHKALEALGTYQFEERHTEQIQRMIKNSYNDDGTEGGRKESLLNALGKIKTEKSLLFIPEIFSSLKSHPGLQVEALGVISQLDSEKANDVLLSLLRQHESSEEYNWRYTNMFSPYRIDSLHQKGFLIKALPLIKHKAYKGGIYTLLDHLLENKRATTSEFAAYRTTLSSDLFEQYKVFEKDSSQHYLNYLTSILGHFPLSKNEIVTLKKLSMNDINHYVAIYASAALLKQQQKVELKDLNKLAHDRYVRGNMLEIFQQQGVEKHFPPDYYRQDSLAVAELHSYVSDEYFEPVNVSIVHQAEMEYKGEKKLFYVASFTDPEEGNAYLGVCGPYSKDKIIAWGDITGSSFDPLEEQEDYNQYLTDYLKQYEEY